MEVPLALGLSFPARVGRQKARAESRPLRPHPVRWEPRSGRQPDVRSCSLFWEVPRAAGAKPGGGWEASGAGAGAAARRTKLAASRVRPQSRSGGARAVKESPEHGKGRERIEVLAGGGTNVTDGRGRAGMRAARAQGLGKEPDPLETAASSEALLEVCWLEPIPSQEMKCYERKKLAGFRGEGTGDSKIWT